MSRSVAMKLVGHQTESIYSRYCITSERANYGLYISGSDVEAAALHGLVESELHRNPQYLWCRELNQLAHVPIRELSSSAEAVWYCRRQQQGCRAGDIKPEVLSRDTDWYDAFERSEVPC